MLKPKVIVLTGFGINGELEMAASFEQNGAESHLCHINDLIANPSKLDNYQILAFPGGFAYADDLGAGVALANRLKNNLWSQLNQFVSRDTLVIGICNGFQMMVNLGILPGFDGEMGERKIALKHNEVGHYQCMWTHIKAMNDNCVWTKGLGVLPISVGHGEGNFTTDAETLARLEQNGQVVLKYCDQNGNLANGVHPMNPNGAMNDIAGISDQSGRILGLMPHPDRFLTAYNEDLWTLNKERAKRAGQEFKDNSPAQQMYKNGVEYFG
jgi:phosphoribosylformylglycinamidine synthase